MLDLNYEPAVLAEDITQLTEEEWLRQRTRGIGGSDVAAVLGISPWKTRRDLFYKKTGVQPLQPDETNWVAKEVGHRLEELVAEIYQRKTGYTVYPIRKIFQHPLYPFMIADVDYFVQKPNGKRGVLECKTSSFMAKDRWADGGIPRHYEVQGKHYLSVTNLDFCAFACLFGNSEGDFLMREIGRDLEEEEMTILELAHFWQDFVAANVEPPYTESGDLVLESIRRYQGKADPSLLRITLASSEIQRLEQFLKLREEKQALDKRGRELEKEIRGVYAPIVDRMGQVCAAVCTDGKTEYQVSYNPTSRTGIKKSKLEKLWLNRLLAERKLACDIQRFYQPELRKAEADVAHKALRMLTEPIDFKADIEAELARSLSSLGLTLSQRQAEAVRMRAKSPLSIITGGPGTGKTTTLRVILDIYKRIKPKGEILLAAPTGRAIRRMVESTGHPAASTLHSALGLAADEGNGFFGGDVSLEADLVIVDEVSMIDMRLAAELFRGIETETQLLLVDDPDQLPSVGPGNVLRELLRCNLIPATHLDIAYRQKEASRIALNAHAINGGRKDGLEYGDDFLFLSAGQAAEAAQLVLNTYQEAISRQNLLDVQILAPFRSRGKCSVKRLNEEIQKLINPPDPP